MKVSKELMSVIACPKCKKSVSEKGKFLLCGKCKLAFPVLEGVPDMLLEEAWELKKAEKSSFKHSLKL